MGENQLPGKPLSAVANVSSVSQSTPDGTALARPEMAVVVISVGAPPEIVGAVRSIIDLQTPCEVVVVNSGGGNIQKRLGSLCQQAKIIEHEALLWAGAARNLGIKASTAPYIGFLAADCRVHAGWIEERMALHRQGHMAVASAVIGTQSWNPFAWASHFTLFANRLPDAPVKEAAPYGASYDRRLFTFYGLFRGDLRLGEDTEFHQRLPVGEKPVWAPKVLTSHRTTSNPISMLTDQFRRGDRFGRYWPIQGGSKKRVKLRLRKLAKILYRRTYSRESRLRLIGHLPLIVINIGVYELGIRKGRKSPTPLTALEAAAWKAQWAGKWLRASTKWQAAADLSPGNPILKLHQVRCLRMAGRFDEALSICDEIERHHPDLIPPLREKAHIYEKIRAREQAAACWRRLVERHPGSGQMQLNLAHALSAINDWHGARAAYEAARELLPNHPGPLRGQAMVASALGVYHTALDLYRTLWDQCKDEGALVNWIELLLRLDRRVEALAVVLKVEASTVSLDKKLAARTAVLQWDHDWEGIVQLLNEHADTTMRSQRLSGLQINSLCFLNRRNDAQAVIAQKNDSPAVTERLTLDVQLRFGDYQAAWPLLEKRLEQGGIRAVISYHVTPLIIGGYELSGLERARDIVASLSKGSYVTPSGETLHLTLPYHKLRVESLAWLEGQEQAQAQYPESEFIGLLSEAHLQTFPSDAYTTLREAGVSLSEMRQTVPEFFPDPIYSLSDTLAVVRGILLAIDEGRPLSLIRLGDGEGRFLPYPPHLESYLENDRVTSTKVWWNMGMTESDLFDEFGVMMPAAVDASDILGIPDLPRLIRGVVVGVGKPGYAMARNARGLLAAFNYVSTVVRRSIEHGTELPMITSCHIHEALAFWGLWPALLRYMREVSLITCHEKLPDALYRQFGVKTRMLHLIPAESKFAMLFGHTKPSEPHFPNVFRRIEHELASTPPGHVVMVAAGALGKVYCQRIREAGGIGIDIGSVADYWCGYITRGYEETIAYRSPDGLPALYDMLANRDVDFAQFWRGNALSTEKLSTFL